MKQYFTHLAFSTCENLDNNLNQVIAEGHAESHNTLSSLIKLYSVFCLCRSQIVSAVSPLLQLYECFMNECDNFFDKVMGPELGVVTHWQNIKEQLWQRKEAL